MRALLSSFFVTAILPTVLGVSLNACGAPDVHDDDEASFTSVSSASTAALTEITSFGANPGALKMFVHAPPGLKPGAPAVLVLHGCLQSAVDAAASGWNAVSDELGFVAVYPEQTYANNPARCFNWAGEYGNPANVVRGQGENQSLKSMVDQVVAAHAVDPARVFVHGFSAGAAMAAVAAATWPDVFAGVGIVAGIPYRCTTVYAEVSDCQKPGKTRSAADWGALVRNAHAGFAGTYPRVSIWQGSADTIVGTANRAELVKQWTDVHGVASQTPTSTTSGAHTHATWKNANGVVVVESHEIAGMGHTVPIEGTGCGTAGTYAKDVGLCSARLVAQFFGLGDANADGGAGSTPSDGGSGSSGGASGSSGGASGSSGSAITNGDDEDDGADGTDGVSTGSPSGAAPGPNVASSAGATCAASRATSPSSGGLGASALSALVTLSFVLAARRAGRARARGTRAPRSAATRRCGEALSRAKPAVRPLLGVVLLATSACLTSSGVGATSDGGAAATTATPAVDASVPGDDPSKNEGNVDGIAYRDLATHPGCSTVGLETRAASAYAPANIPGYRCAAKAYPVATDDPNKPIILLVHGNSSTPADWERFPADQPTAPPMLAERLVERGHRVLAVDVRYDLVDDPKNDNAKENAAQNFDHGWAVPIVEHFIDAVMTAFPDRRLSLAGFSVGPTIARDALRRLHRANKKPFERFQALVFAAGSHHGVSTFRSLCKTNPTMRGTVACELGDRTAFQPTALLAPLNGPDGAWETPCADGDAGFGQRGVCGGNKIAYTTLVMKDVQDGTYQDEFVSEGSSRLAGADNRALELTDNDETGYFYNGIFKNHMGAIRSEAALAIMVEALTK